MYDDHSMRTVSAVARSALGSYLLCMEGMARWQSPMILHCARMFRVSSLPRSLNVVRRLPRLKHMPCILHDILCLCRARWMSYNKLKGYSSRMTFGPIGSPISRLRTRVYFVLNLNAVCGIKPACTTACAKYLLGGPTAVGCS